MKMNNYAATLFQFSKKHADRISAKKNHKEIRSRDQKIRIWLPFKKVKVFKFLNIYKFANVMITWRVI